MKLLRSLAVLCSILYVSAAFIISDSKITFKSEDNQDIEIGTITEATQKLAPIAINSLQESLHFKFKLDLSKSKSKEVPKQLSLLVGVAGRDLEIPVTPKVKDSSKNKKVKLVSFKVDIDSLPKSILHYAISENELVTATLIIANDKKSLAKKENNIFQQVFDLQFTEQVEYVDNFKAPARYESKDEVSHTFPTAPKNAPALLANIFMVAILVTDVLLFLNWSKFGAISFKNMPAGNFVSFVGFFGSIVVIEYLFTLYYLGSSIFETINYTAVVAAFGLIIGTKFLRSMSQRI